MSQSDFQARLDRLRPSETEQNTVSLAHRKTPKSRSSSVQAVQWIALIFIFSSSALAKYTNENYETLKQTSPYLSLVLFVLCLTGLVVGVLLFVRPMLRRSSTVSVNTETYSDRGSRQWASFGASGAMLAVGILAVKYANSNYVRIQEEDGIAFAIGAGIFAFALIAIAIVLTIRAAIRVAYPKRTNDQAGAIYQASSGAKTLWSLLGLLLGAFACFEIFLAAAARQFETEFAEQVADGGVILAAILALLTSLFLIASSIWRGRGLARVTVFFWAGGLLTYLAMGLLKVDLSQSEAFAVYLQ